MARVHLNHPPLSSTRPHNDDLVVLCLHPHCCQCGPWAGAPASAHGDAPDPWKQNLHFNEPRVMRAQQSRRRSPENVFETRIMHSAPSSVSGTALSVFQKAPQITGCHPTTPCLRPHAPCCEEVTQSHGANLGSPGALLSLRRKLRLRPSAEAQRVDTGEDRPHSSPGFWFTLFLTVS